MAPFNNESSPSGSSLKPAALSIAPGPSTPQKSAKVRTGLALVAVLAVGVGLKAFVLAPKGPNAAAAEFPLPAVEFAEPAQDGSLQALAGSWILSSCTPATGNATSTLVSVEGGQVTEARRTFEAAGCLNELYTVTLNKSINRLTSGAGAALEAEYSLNQASLRVHNAALLNQQRFLGQSDWKDGETRDLMGPLSVKLFGSPLHAGETTYDLLQLDGHRLFARAAGQVALSLPTSLAGSALARIN